MVFLKHTDKQLLAMMAELKVDHNVEQEELRKAFFAVFKNKFINFNHHNFSKLKNIIQTKVAEWTKLRYHYFKKCYLLPNFLGCNSGIPSPQRLFGK
jgi:hypothetical protein